MNQEPNYDDEELFDEERERRRGLDLTSTGFRIGATLFVLALSLILIYVAVRPNSEEEALDPVPTLAANPTSGPAQGLATFTPGPTSTPPPLDEPTPGPADEGGPPGLAVDGPARISGTGGAGVNLRTSAGTAAAIVQILPDETALTLLEGPTEADGFSWWRVRLEDGTEGWVVQDFLAP